MFTTFPKVKLLVQRFCRWLFGVRIEARSSPAPASVEVPFVVPMLFAARTAEAPDRPSNAIDLFPVHRSQEWSFAARLKSVATDNVPKARKGRRATIVPPAGKAVPTKTPHHLKSYKPSTGVPATAPWKKSAVSRTSRPSNVIAFAKTSRRSSERGFAVERIAA